MRRTALLFILAVLGLGAAGCGSPSAASRSGTPAGRAELSKVTAAISKAASVHYVDVTTIDAKRETLVGAIGPSQAQESLDVAGHKVLQIIVSQGIAYLTTTSASVLESALSLSTSTAASLTGQWITLSSSDQPYRSVVASLTVAAAMKPYLPLAHSAAIGPTTTSVGQAVVELVATTSPTKGTTERTSLLVDPKTSLPRLASLSAVNGTNSETKRTTFSGWGQPVSIVIPSSSTAYASLAEG